VSRTRVRRRRTTLAVCAALVGAAWAGPALRVLAQDPPVRVDRSSYVVRQGDTLWSIARHLSPEGDPRPVVDSLSADNGISAGELVPGQVLVVSAGG
jgi:nucleoid-associated protein YgaU